jgi:uncharacterized protein YbjT (DUF2867 family)
MFRQDYEYEDIADGFRNFDLEDVHVEGAERIAEAVAKYDVDRFIHVSSYNADPKSPSEFFSTKVRTSGIRLLLSADLFFFL